MPTHYSEFNIQDYLGGKGPGIVGALFLFIFNSFFAVGWLGMTWLYPAEIVPLRIRAPANALSTSANWVGCNDYMSREIPMLTVSGVQLHGSNGHSCSIRFNPVQDLHRLRRHVNLSSSSIQGIC